MAAPPTKQAGQNMRNLDSSFVWDNKRSTRSIWEKCTKYGEPILQAGSESEIDMEKIT
jgi:hypothetical protein